MSPTTLQGEYSTEVKIAVIEVYNEQIYDLLGGRKCVFCTVLLDPWGAVSIWRWYLRVPELKDKEGQ